MRSEDGGAFCLGNYGLLLCNAGAVVNVTQESTDMGNRQASFVKLYADL